MRKTKKLLAVILGCTMLFGVTLTANAASHHYGGSGASCHWYQVTFGNCQYCGVYTPVYTCGPHGGYWFPACNHYT